MSNPKFDSFDVQIIPPGHFKNNWHKVTMVTLLTLHIGITELNENNYKYQCWEKRQNWKN